MLRVCRATSPVPIPRGGEVLRTPAKLFGPQPLAAVTTVFAVGIIMPSMINTGGQSSGQASSSRSVSQAKPASGPVWAVTVTGRKVLVPKPKFAPTPIHPEKITHPRADTMGAITAAHAPWPRSARIRPLTSVPQLPGIDISAYQGNINWRYVAPYIDFSYAKATEGNYYTNPVFYNQYVGPYNYRVIRGAYHFAIPNNSSGQSQARYFISHGGGWSPDGMTLPGALDIEYNPYGSECYGLTHSQMNTWIENFVQEYAYLEHAYPVIYTTTDWWTTCTGNATRFGQWDPLWIANYSASGGGPLPSGWGFYTFWQYASGGSMPGDQDVFNGAHSQLSTLATRG
jgi:GH25 family lysozyme M1 (1,4-beta-N-acetylmuramidase)